MGEPTMYFRLWQFCSCPTCMCYIGKIVVTLAKLWLHCPTCILIALCSDEVACCLLYLNISHWVSCGQKEPTMYLRLWQFCSCPRRMCSSGKVTPQCNICLQLNVPI